MGEHKRYAVFSLSIVMHYITPGYTSATYDASEVLCFCLACAVVCQLRFPSYAEYISLFLSIHKNTERTSMKFAGGNHYYEEIKLLHLGEIRTGTKVQHTRENYNRLKSVLLPW